MLEHVLDAIARGFAVFPLGENSKLPTVKFTEAPWPTRDPAVARKEWKRRPNLNYAISTDDMVAVDVDRKNGKNGTAAFLNLDLPLDTLAMSTPSGGEHYLYACPTPAANSAGKLGEGVDVRGWHGFIVGPGSVTPTGAYTILNDAPMAPAPEHFLARLSQPRSRAQKANGHAPDDET